MAKKHFKAESKKLLDMMINSIYTNKEIFLRELISNASDALDKRYYGTLRSGAVGVKKDDYRIEILADKDARTLTIRDNGIGMTAAELETNLGTIAHSGSQAFREEMEKAQAEDADKKTKKKSTADIIGQFGVGFYSAFMVADAITVTSCSEEDGKTNVWESKGVDGYTITEGEAAEPGTTIVLHLKQDLGDDTYSQFLEESTLRTLVRKYSDYIHYPIRIADETVNSMEPIWKKQKSRVKPEEYNEYYKGQFNDYEDPLRVIRTSVEGISSYTALLFIPQHAPYDYYSADYEKGLALYSSGVMIMEKCKDLLPDYFNFVRGIVDSQDLTLNISRETLQEDRQLRAIAKNLEKKIRKELLDFLKNDRENYEKFFEAFGRQLKYGLYDGFGMNKEKLEDLVLFWSDKEEKLVTLQEYVDAMPEDQTVLYYAPGETNEKIAMLPQVQSVLAAGKDVLFLTDEIDEFAIRMMMNYKEKNFVSVSEESPETATEEEKAALEEKTKEQQGFLDFVKETLGDKIAEVAFTSRLSDAPVTLTTKGGISIEMEKTLNRMPMGGGVKAQRVLELNPDHAVIQKAEETLASDAKDDAARMVRLLYAQAVLLSGLTVEDPAEMAGDICAMILQ